MNPKGNAVDSGLAESFTNGDNEIVLMFASTRNDAGNWNCTVSVTGPTGELPLSPIVRTITVTVVGEYMECYACSKRHMNGVYWSFMTHCNGLTVLEHPFSY